MIEFIKKHTAKHLSLFVLVSGAAAFFFTNFLLKEKLSSHEYGQYSIVITFFSLVFIFGLLGFEQVFLRHSTVLKKNYLTTQKIQVKAILIILLITTLLGVISFNYFYEGIVDNFYLMLIATVSTSSITIFYSVYRLNENFVFAQIVSNATKLLLFLAVIVLILIKCLSFKIVIYITIFSPVLIFLTTIFLFKRKIKIEYNVEYSRKTILNSFFYFFIAITSFSLINFCDRFIIESKFGYEKAGDYFYLTNIFLAPFAILQSYVGFKKLIVYKKSFSIGAFTKTNKKIVFYGVLMSIFLFICSIALDMVQVVSFKFHEYKLVILLLLVLGIIRLYSLSINSAFDVVTNSKNLKKANLIIFCCTVIILGISILFLKSIETIIISMITIWVLRAYVLNKILITQIKKESNVG